MKKLIVIAISIMLVILTYAVAFAVLDIGS
jgi:hypothetical protein